MADPYLGEIRMFAGNFAPRGWAFCDGQWLSVSQYDALFNLIGTTYGGDGVTSFGLPDCRGRIPIHMGQGGGMTNRIIGSSGGTETVTLLTSQLPPHTHSWNASSANAAQVIPSQNGFAETSNSDIYNTDVTNNHTNMNVDMIGYNGFNGPHQNTMPTLCVYFIIALFGIYPTKY